jgi:hypothetical protein
MKKLTFINNLLFLVTITISAQQNDFPKLTGPYLGQKPPGITPEIFAPGIVSTDAHKFSCCFSPDGNECYFSRRQPTTNDLVIMFSKLVNGVWTEPDIAEFATQFSFESFVTPDNKRLYFQSGKVVAGTLQMFTMYVERNDTGWGDEKDPGESFNLNKTMHISATTNGTIYTTDISGGMGSECLGRIMSVNGKY